MCMGIEPEQKLVTSCRLARFLDKVTDKCENVGPSNSASAFQHLAACQGRVRHIRPMVVCACEAGSFAASASQCHAFAAMLLCPGLEVVRVGAVPRESAFSYWDLF